MSMCSETSPPRLSFSNDLPVSPINHHVDLPCRRDTSLMTMMDSNSEFEFEFNNTRNSVHSESSSADELFSNGIILPIQIQNQPTTKKHTLAGEPSYSRLPPRPCSSPVEKTKKQSTKESHSRSFWGFGRSKSMNCDTKKSLFSSSSSLPRSNSTGTATNPKGTNSRDYGKNHGGSSPYPVQKSGSGKGYGGSYYGDGLRVSPVLNIPTPYISKGTANLFNLGSFLRVGKAKKTKN
ncbi:hypothetical protein QN277_012368 [Acacia crassicarpa]|uniref:Uncharacterized protein n=2 Tax=Acacia crassicarpa TaxID=499986 RepID=A0AAE1N0F4_9FABA|nr:hypothetical protein QN277_012368 [Acacia crassicarpa]